MNIMFTRWIKLPLESLNRLNMSKYFVFEVDKYERKINITTKSKRLDELRHQSSNENVKVNKVLTDLLERLLWMHKGPKIINPSVRYYGFMFELNKEIIFKVTSPTLTIKELFKLYNNSTWDYNRKIPKLSNYYQLKACIYLNVNSKK